MIFIVGMPRSGTTLVESIFLCHPEVTSIGESTALAECLARMRQKWPDKSEWQAISALDTAGGTVCGSNPIVALSRTWRPKRVRSSPIPVWIGTRLACNQRSGKEKSRRHRCCKSERQSVPTGLTDGGPTVTASSLSSTALGVGTRFPNGSSLIRACTLSLRSALDLDPSNIKSSPISRRRRPVATGPRHRPVGDIVTVVPVSASVRRTSSGSPARIRRCRSSRPMCP